MLKPGLENFEHYFTSMWDECNCVWAFFGIAFLWDWNEKRPFPVQWLLLSFLYDPAIPLLGIYPEETKIEKDTCIPLFIAALFIIARTWKKLRFPLTDKWIKKKWYIYTMEYYSAIKKEWTWVSWTEVDEPRTYYTEWSKSERGKQMHILMPIYGI